MGAGRSSTVPFVINMNRKVLREFFGENSEYKGGIGELDEINQTISDISLEWEREHYNDKFETVLIVNPDGTTETFTSDDEGAVAFSLEARDVTSGKYHNSVLVHNHPNFQMASPSGQDIITAASIGLRQMRVVDRAGYSSVLTIPENARNKLGLYKISELGRDFAVYGSGQKFDDARSVVRNNIDKVDAAFYKLKPDGLKNDYNKFLNTVYHKAQSNMAHNWLKRNARKYGLRYTTNADTTSFFPSGGINHE